MIVEFSLPIKPMSINNYTFSDRRHKTPDARAWETQVNALLIEEKGLVDLADDWNEHGGVFKVWLTFTYPYHIFRNKQGAISSKTIDLSNCEKNLIDRIFGDQMDVNDKHIVELYSEKKDGPSYDITVKIELIR